MTKQAFTEKYYADAVAAAKGTKIFADTVITAAYHESGAGESGLTKKANNFFGFKGRYNDQYITLPTKEEVNGQLVTINAEFRKYPTSMDSFKDYVRLLQTARYVNAGVTKAATPALQFDAIARAGYATDSKYAAKLLGVYNSIKSFFTTTRK